VTVLLALAASAAPAAASDDPPRYLAGDVVPNDGLFVPDQWFLQPARGIDAFPLHLPDAVHLRPVVVAVVDGGIDPTIRELAPDAGAPAVVIDRRSFVPGQPLGTSTHGTFVAGLIAAHTGNGYGLA
jgi:subtilisin family serine protease